MGDPILQYSILLIRVVLRTGFGTVLDSDQSFPTEATVSAHPTLKGLVLLTTPLKGHPYVVCKCSILCTGTPWKKMQDLMLHAAPLGRTARNAVELHFALPRCIQFLDQTDRAQNDLCNSTGQTTFKEFISSRVCVLRHALAGLPRASWMHRFDMI